MAETMGALSVTGQPKYRHDFEPLMPGVRFVPRTMWPRSKPLSATALPA